MPPGAASADCIVRVRYPTDQANKGAAAVLRCQSDASGGSHDSARGSAGPDRGTGGGVVVGVEEVAVGRTSRSQLVVFGVCSCPVVWLLIR